jgi:hypothetical protein
VPFVIVTVGIWQVFGPTPGVLPQASDKTQPPLSRLHVALGEQALRSSLQLVPPPRLGGLYAQPPQLSVSWAVSAHLPLQHWVTSSVPQLTTDHPERDDNQSVGFQFIEPGKAIQNADFNSFDAGFATNVLTRMFSGRRRYAAKDRKVARRDNGETALHSS